MFKRCDNIRKQRSVCHVNHGGDVWSRGVGGIKMRREEGAKAYIWMGKENMWDPPAKCRLLRQVEALMEHASFICKSNRWRRERRWQLETEVRVVKGEKRSERRRDVNRKAVKKAGCRKTHTHTHTSQEHKQALAQLNHPRVSHSTL